MTATPYPIPRETRETTVLVGNGTPGPYGPTTFKVFDIADVVVWLLAADGEQFTDATDNVTVTKTANLALDTVSVTFGENIPSTTKYIIQSRRTAERSLAITKGGVIDAGQLEKELSKIASAVSELRRDVDRALRPDFGATLQILPSPETDKVLGWSAGSELVNKTIGSLGLTDITPTGAERAASIADRFARDSIWVEDFRRGSDDAASADYSAIMRAITLAETTGRPVKLHPQQYIANAYIEIPSGLAIEGFGSGYWSTRRSEIAAAAGMVNSLVALETGSKNIAMRGIRLNGRAELNVPTLDDHVNLRCLYAETTDHLYGYDIWFYNARSHGCSFAVGDDPDENGCSNYLERCVASYNGSRLQIDMGGLGGTGFNAEAMFFRCISEWNYLAGWKTSRGQIEHCIGRYNNEFFEDGLGDINLPRLKILNNIIANNTYGLYLKGGSDDYLVFGNTCTANGTSGIMVRNTVRRGSIIANVCKNNGTTILADNRRSYEPTYDLPALVRSDVELGLDGITLLQTSGVPQDLIIVANHCYDSRPAGQKTQEYGLYTTSNPTGVSLDMNVFGSVRGSDDFRNKNGALRISTTAKGFKIGRGNVGLDSEVIDTTAVTVTGPQGSAQPLMAKTIPARGLHQEAILRVTGQFTVAGTTDAKTLRDFEGNALVVIASGTQGAFTVEQKIAFKSSSGDYEMESKIFAPDGTMTTKFTRAVEALTADFAFKFQVNVPGSGDTVQQTRLDMWQER